MILLDRGRVEVILQDQVVYAKGYFTVVIWRGLTIPQVHVGG